MQAYKKGVCVCCVIGAISEVLHSIEVTVVSILSEGLVLLYIALMIIHYEHDLDFMKKLHYSTTYY